MDNGGTSRNESASGCSSSLPTIHVNSPKLDENDANDKDICKQLKWDSLQMDEVPYLGHDQSGSTNEITLNNMPDLVMQCIFESFDLRDRCLASQV
ncbi:unnamed protein product [Onchocerca flexuosa]|uniref:F-box domain-containing protein n=1 Tax=Onchocerca flexuosa TaxID=387005 RepID=A0A183I7Z0_9BILA|nr:unnamed protein product [Onchocerca flexuosa]